MSSPLASLSKRTQAYLVCFLTLPWVVFGIVAFDLLPADWQFEHWPKSLQSLSMLGLVLFMIADLLFALWYWTAIVRDAYGDKGES